MICMNLKKYLEYTKRYTGDILWPLTVFRRRWLIKQTAIEAAQISVKGWILDIGTGPAYLPIELAKNCKNVHVVGIDISQALLDDANKKISKNKLTNTVSILKAKAELLPFADNTFETVQSTFSFHQWQNQSDGIMEVHRVLKPDCQAVIVVGKQYLLGNPKIFSKKSLFSEIDNMCFKAGFKKVEITNIKNVNGCLRILMTK